MRSLASGVSSRPFAQAVDALFLGRLRELETMLHEARAAQSQPPSAGQPPQLAEAELCTRGRIESLEAEADQLCLDSIVDVHMLRRLVGCVGGYTLPGQLKPFVHSAYVLHDRDGVSRHTFKQYEVHDITGMDAWIGREWVWVDGLILAKIVSRTMFTSIRKAISAVPGGFDGGRLADARAMVAAFQRDLRQIVAKVARHGDKPVATSWRAPGATCCGSGGCSAWRRGHCRRPNRLCLSSSRRRSIRSAIECTGMCCRCSSMSLAGIWRPPAAHGARARMLSGARFHRSALLEPTGGGGPALQVATPMRPEGLQRVQPQQPRWVMVYELRPLAPLAASPQFVRNARDAVAQHGGWSHLRSPSDWGSSATAPADRAGVWWSKPSLDPATGRCVESLQEGVFLGEEDHLRLQQTARRRRA